MVFQAGAGDEISNSTSKDPWIFSCLDPAIPLAQTSYRLALALVSMGRDSTIMIPLETSGDEKARQTLGIRLSRDYRYILRHDDDCDYRLSNIDHRLLDYRTLES
ncbi:predicted protein [Histoplasma capsulatum G186AR]|uniref:Uncharacterized protein n=1 Tax=Ajellomyces capsulatus (strain G186AR / H82 / ATCC MYA-2454 / RMSCC 2432) TaxID=447093 RepID=C0NGA9_AJECG|nr:uncharacterized protein HCBG_01925 [Histoplasma capsulatum G186AR]EEH10280.1 predicted protein [Histoplasma capsulatum G186AR]